MTQVYTSPDGNEMRVVGESLTTDEGHVFEPVTDGWAMGYRVTHADGRVEFIYLNPSSSDEGEKACAFVYIGPDGSPSGQDQPSHYYDLFEA